MTYTIISTTADNTGKSKVYLIDIDGTLVTSASGRRWASSASDWIFLGPVAATLDRLHREGWIVALITNQSDWKTSPDPEVKITSILAALQEINGWTPWCLIATATRKEQGTLYRKPGRGLYDLLVEQLSPTTITEVRMCGDAVGPSDPYPPYRWASSDFDFAKAVSATFVRPCDLFPPCSSVSISASQEIILLMGNPGSGKSSLARDLVTKGYIHVEQDNMTSKAATKKAVITALAPGRSVVVDATHGSSTNRAPYLSLGFPVRVLWCIRDGRPFNALREKPVPEVAYAVYSKHFVRPEGDVTIIY
jgi:bifunctional polynucleotide phosphatase/kinase